MRSKSSLKRQEPQGHGRFGPQNAAAAARGLLITVSLLAGLPATSAFGAQTPAAPKKRLFRVVIDPGHGGQDQGTVYDVEGARVTEKEVTLAIAQEAARRLRARGYSVVLTRTQDVEVPLPARTALANRLKADIFLSIHMNSTSTPMVSDAEGIETFILNNATDASSRRLARLENSVLGSSRATDATEQTDVALILKDLTLDANLSESKRLACTLQRQLVVATAPKGARPSSPDYRARDRGVKQALFHVLLGADMPSVLVEVGFLSSPRDRELVLSPEGRRSISRAIVRAVDRFRKNQGTPLAEAQLRNCKVN